MGAFFFFLGMQKLDIDQSPSHAARFRPAGKQVLVEGLEQRCLMSGTDGFYSASVTATPASSASSPLTPGSSVTVTVNLSTDNGPPATGTVTILENGTPVGTAGIDVPAGNVWSSSATTSIALVAAPPGGNIDNISVSYAGDANTVASTDLCDTYVYVTPTPAAPTVLLGITDDSGNSISSATPGQDVRLTAGVFGSGAAPTGTVTFNCDGVAIASTPSPVGSDGSAGLDTDALPAGTDVITAVYGGDSNYTSVTSTGQTVTVAASQQTPTVTLTLVPGGSIAQGDTLSMSAAVGGDGVTTPTGSVTFYNGTTAITSAISLDGNANAVSSTSTLPLGDNSITAVYTGDSIYSPVTSAASPVKVTGAATVTLKASTTKAIAGQTVKLTADVTESGKPASGVSVDFVSGSTDLGQATTNAGGKATLATKALPPGQDAVQANATDSNGNATASNTVDVTEGVKLKAPKPMDPKSTSASDNPHFTWSLVLGANYSIQIKDVTPGVTNPFNTTQTGIGTNSYQYNSGLSPAHTYEWQVQATENLPGIGTLTTSWSKPVRFKVEEQPSASYWARVDYAVSNKRKTIFTLTAYEAQNYGGNVVDGPPHYLKLALNDYTGPAFSSQTGFTLSQSPSPYGYSDFGTEGLVIVSASSPIVGGGGYTNTVSFTFGGASFIFYPTSDTSYDAATLTGKLTITPAPHFDNSIWPNG